MININKSYVNLLLFVEFWIFCVCHLYYNLLPFILVFWSCGGFLGVLYLLYYFGNINCASFLLGFPSFEVYLDEIIKNCANANQNNVDNHHNKRLTRGLEFDGWCNDKCDEEGKYHGSTIENPDDLSLAYRKTKLTA